MTPRTSAGNRSRLMFPRWLFPVGKMLFSTFPSCEHLMNLYPNTIVDRKYRVIRKIGEGGMASVYEAEVIHTGMGVALKQMHFSVKNSETNTRRFLREAAALGVLNHPNIVRMYEVAEHEGTPILVMELLNGKSLGDLLDEDQRPNTHDLRQLAKESLAALQHAHQLGLIHRDIKPDNIFLHTDANGETTYKLVDFGIARSAEDHSLTSTGQFVGTRRYASPEQIRSPRAVDMRTDLFSLGVTLWECATGETPHADADTEFAVMRAITETPYFSVPPGCVDVQMEHLVARLTANDPNDRIANAEQAIRLLSNEISSPASGSQTANPVGVTSSVDEADVRRMNGTMGAWAGPSAPAAQSPREPLNELAARFFVKHKLALGLCLVILVLASLSK